MFRDLCVAINLKCSQAINAMMAIDMKFHICMHIRESSKVTACRLKGDGYQI